MRQKLSIFPNVRPPRAAYIASKCTVRPTASVVFGYYGPRGHSPSSSASSGCNDLYYLLDVIVMIPTVVRSSSAAG